MASRKAYPSDLTDAEWGILEPMIPTRAEDATNVLYEGCDSVNGILYVLQSSCLWRLVPQNLPVWGTLYSYWRMAGIWDQILETLRKQGRKAQDRDEEPSVAVIDSQSIKTSAVRGPEEGSDNA